MSGEHKDFEEESHKEKDSGTAAENSFDRLMFGPSRAEKRQSVEETPKYGNLSDIDLVEVMGHIDTLVESARQLKPIFSKIRPLFNQFLKK